MPFLSDMLDQSRRQQDEEQALARENLAEASLLQAHLSHRSALHSRFRFDPAAVMDCLRAEVLGQEPALQAVEDMLKVVRADIADPRRPLFSALFLGPTGVGKTEIVRALARALHGDAEGFCRVDMNTLSQEHYAAALTGAPPGYVGAKEGTTLLEQDKLDGQSRAPRHRSLRRTGEGQPGSGPCAAQRARQRPAAGRFRRTHLPFPQHPGVHDQQSLRP
ncbi:putative chaperone [Pseudomonas aeruginosa]|nr:putative chaperone [Pseudomonas aeruginosa]